MTTEQKTAPSRAGVEAVTPDPRVSAMDRAVATVSEAAAVVGITPVEYLAVIGDDRRRAQRIVRDRDLIEGAEHPLAVAVALLRGKR